MPRLIMHVDLDAFFATSGTGGNLVWLNNGSGTFSDSGQALGSLSSAGLGLGDFDGDGDLDAYFGNYSSAEDEIWLNDGSGTFTDSTQNLGSATSRLSICSTTSAVVVNPVPSGIRSLKANSP